MATVLDRPGLGHNSLSIGDELIDRLALDYEGLLSRRDQLAEGENRVPVIEDEEAARRLSDFIDMVGGLVAQTKKDHQSVKDPYLKGGRQVDDFFFRGVKEPMEALHARLKLKLKGYLDVKALKERKAREEAERLAREEAERKEAEARAKADTAETDEDLAAAIDAEELAARAQAELAQASAATQVKNSELGNVKGSIGRTKSLKTFWDFDGLNRETLDLNKLRPYLPTDGLEKAVRAYIAQGGRSLDGCRIFENTRL